MKTHTTNYFDTFIEVAADTKADFGTKPPSKCDKRTIAELQYDIIANHPYQFTSDDIIFQVFAYKNDLLEADFEKERELFFSKGQPCFRTSPLTKIYGFGIHCDSCGKIALYGMETDQYQQFLSDPKIKKIKAMKLGK